MLDLRRDPQERRGSLATPVVLAAITGACVSLAGALVSMVDGGARWAWFLSGCVSFLCALPLWRAGRREAAGRVVFLTAWTLAALMAFTGGVPGLDEKGIVILPVLAISANVLLRRREAILGMVGVLALLALILGTDAYADWGTAASPGERLVGFGFAFVLVGVPCVASRLLADASASVAEKAREYELALGLANDCLQAEASRRGALIEELEGRNAELERFCYTVSHDLKNPLVTIGGFLGYIERNAVKGDLTSLRQDLDRIGRAHQKMLRLLDELARTLASRSAAAAVRGRLLRGRRAGGA